MNLKILFISLLIIFISAPSHAIDLKGKRKQLVICALAFASIPLIASIPGHHLSKESKDQAVQAAETKLFQKKLDVLEGEIIKILQQTKMPPAEVGEREFTFTGIRDRNKDPVVLRQINGSIEIGILYPATITDTDVITITTYSNTFKPLRRIEINSTINAPFF
jgi:hypothetical protein